MDGLDLTETLKLERIEVNLFRGTAPDPSAKRIFGGHVIAQSLLAAYETVDDRLCHSLHCYFIRPGDPTAPVIFEVDRSRDGGSFTTRRVIAVQHGQQIFNLAASFQNSEAGFEHQFSMPEAPPWEGETDDFETIRELFRDAPPEEQAWLDRPRPIEMRTVGGRFEAAPQHREPFQKIWFRARAPLPEDPRIHQVVMAYASDLGLLGTCVLPHAVNWQVPEFQSASLDHAMWFHRPSNANGWHLYDMDSPSSSGGRGLNRGSIYAEDGRLVASCVQEGLIRMRRPGT